MPRDFTSHRVVVISLRGSLPRRAKAILAGIDSAATPRLSRRAASTAASTNIATRVSVRLDEGRRSRRTGCSAEHGIRVRQGLVRESYAGDSAITARRPWLSKQREHHHCSHHGPGRPSNHRKIRQGTQP